MHTSSIPPDEHHVCTVVVGERTRRYLVHVPSQACPTSGWTVVLIFHGGGSNPAQMVDFTGLSDAAEEFRFLAIYPAGTGIIDTALTFNAGNCCGRALKEKVDEIAFVTALLHDVAHRWPIDQRRIYATGMSNGAMMSYLVADKLSERIAAIAPVGGPMGAATCAPTYPVPVLHFHGSADEYAPLAGGVGRRSISKTNFYSVEHTLAQWRQANHCKNDAIIETITHLPDDGLTTTRFTWRPASNESGAKVVFYRIDGLGHTWPGRVSRFQALGKTTTSLHATRIMCEFFAQHAR